MKKLEKHIIICIVYFSLITPLINPNNIVTSNTLPAIEKYQTDKIDNLIEFIMEKSHFPSISASIIKNDEIIWSKGYGYSDLENRTTATDNTIYKIASVTKTITGTALMQLYDKGFFELDDDVNYYLPFFLRNPNFPDIPITYRMLLSHTSSLLDSWKYYSNVNMYDYNGPPFQGYPSPWIENYVLPNGSNYSPMVWNSEFSPGTIASYASINFDIIAYLIEVISGDEFHDYCRKNIFIPLDMESTSFCIQDFDIKNLAVPYVWDGVNNHVRKKPMVYIHFPAGGLFSNSLDLSHFMIAHINNGKYNGTELLSESTINLMHQIQTPENQMLYGLAWDFLSRSIWTDSGRNYFLRTVYSGHGGAHSNGATAEMYMKLNGLNTAVIILINCDAKFNKDGWNGLQFLREVLFFKALSINSS